MIHYPEHYFINANAFFPNSKLPVILYKKMFHVPPLFPALYLRSIFKMNKWSNSRRGGILTCHHYHSTSHEVIGVYRGETILQLGGEEGTRLRIAKGDVLIIPAGVAHKNLGDEQSIGVVAAYPEGMSFDMNYENAGDRSLADKNIEKVPMPLTDPVGATASSLPVIWALSARHKPVTAISWMKGDPRESLYKLRS